jgi:hypothetical protein
MNDHADLLSLSRRLTQQAGLSDPVKLERLAGGRNNRVFRVTLISGDCVVLKNYYRNKDDPRDRLGAEWAFINYAWNLGIRRTPHALAVDHENNAGLYSFVEGRKLTPNEIDGSKVDAALTFIKELNPRPHASTILSSGSEACFTINQHIATIDRRVGRLLQLDPETPLRREAEDFITSRLQPHWEKVRATLILGCARLGVKLGDWLAAEETCISPSDFGFHNAVVDENGAITFIDFEYAGQDDPAKLISDFFCQPEIPIPFAYFDQFANGVVSALGLAPLHLERMRLLIDAYRIKWLCIMLNDFLPLGSARRAFSAIDSRAMRCTERLAAAKSAMHFLMVHSKTGSSNTRATQNLKEVHGLS